MLLSMFSLEILGAFVTTLLCVIGTAAWYLHQQHLKYDHLPGPPRDSFWSGHLPSIRKVVSKGGTLGDYILDLTKTYGALFRICLWNQTFVVVTGPELIKEVLVTGNLPKSKTVYSKLTHILGVRYVGEGLESETDKKKWIIHRVHFNQWFKPHHLRQFTPDYNEFADNLVQTLEQHADGKKHVHMENFFHKVAMHLLSKVAYNFDLGKLDGKPHPFASSLTFTLDAFPKVVFNPFFSLNPFSWKYCQQIRNAVAKIRLYAHDRLTERRKANLRGDHVPYDLLQSIIELKEKNPSEITDDVLLDEIITFFIGGQETTANTLSFMVSLLSRNPDCYKKLQEEIDTNVAAMSVLTPADLDDLPYLDMVMKETLRLYPIVKATYREAVRDCSLEGHDIPIGSDIMVSFYATSRSEKNFGNPHQFVPERFDPKANERVSAYATTPFSAGPHSCIGKKFAEIETKIIMAKIMQNFDFELVPGQPMGFIDGGTLRIKGGSMCFLRPRKEKYN
ncbi:cholesterol 24-hydroxylase-like [Pecten maximus]|uniref:cholesterol 24-hydroxylase-like n=1 Tax=Pecten maximus TaxID=6579 RepID=UPI0014581427|nr:cholesterol 24-hydroxylase-like [Pecten maximus]XP_033734291.1 cholesterol 24-hydroxylase-like [Pecten maximus]